VPGARAVEPHVLGSDAVPPMVPLAPSVPPAAVGSAPYGWPAGPPKVRKERKGVCFFFSSCGLRCASWFFHAILGLYFISFTGA
jgi:hypothetical protein